MASKARGWAICSTALATFTRLIELSTTAAP